MSSVYQIAFEQVQLLSGLNPDQAVYLLMTAKAYDPDTPNDPFYNATLGGLSPNDANDLSGNIVSGTGFYAASLPVGATVRNDVTNGDHPSPRFTLPLLSLDSNQILELSVLMAPEVWFQNVRESASDSDKVMGAILGAAAGSSGLGIVGGAIGAAVGWLGLGSDQTVVVPCYNVVIAARNQWTGAEVAKLASGMHQFGPTGPDPGSYGCARIDSFYWISITEQMQFSPRAPMPKVDCSLLTVDDPSLGSQFNNRWGDAGDEKLDCARAIISPSGPSACNVILFEPGGLLVKPAPVEFSGVPITTENALPLFGRNIYPDAGCPARSVTPNCTMCKQFDNVDYSIYVPGKLLAGVGLRSTHIGSRPLLAISVDNDRVLGAGPVVSQIPNPFATRAQEPAHPQRRAHHVAPPPPSAALRINPSTVIQQVAPGMVVMSGKFSFPPGGVVLTGGVASVFSALTLRLSPTKVLYLYGEYPASGDLTCFRLRYRATGRDGRTVTDVMLLPDAAVIN